MVGESKQRNGWESASIRFAALAAFLGVAYVVQSLVFRPGMEGWGFALLWLALIHLAAIAGIGCSAFGRSRRGFVYNIAAIALFWIVAMLILPN